MCGIIGIAGHEEAGYLSYLGLHALQHRGEEAAGIASSDGRVCHRAMAPGLVDETSSRHIPASEPPGQPQEAPTFEITLGSAVVRVRGAVDGRTLAAVLKVLKGASVIVPPTSVRVPVATKPVDCLFERVALLRRLQRRRRRAAQLA